MIRERARPGMHQILAIQGASLHLPAYVTGCESPRMSDESSAFGVGVPYSLAWSGKYHMAEPHARS